MKRLLARSATALLAAPLVLLAVQNSPGSMGASAKAPSAAVVAQARSNFIKVMSAHAPAVGHGGWISPGVQHRGSAGGGNGTVTAFPSMNWSGYADAESASKTVSSVSGDWTVPAEIGRAHV